MTTAPPVPRARSAPGRAGLGERQLRRRTRRRLVREEIAAVAVLLAALLATLVVLGLQWLGSGQSLPVGVADLVAGPLGGGR